MFLRTASSRARARWAALVLGCALVAGGCSGDDAGEPVDEQADEAAPEDGAEEEEPAEDEAQDEQDAADDEGQDEQAAAGDTPADCTVDAGTVNEIVDVGVEITFDDVNELANDGVSCMYEGDNDDVTVFASVSVGTWDGTDERVQGVVSQTEEYFGEPVATPDLGDQAFLFDDDFGGVSLVVFVDDMQYSTTIGGSGWDGTPLETLEGRQSMASDLYEAAAG